ncbi:hypothetical protein C9J85_10075 [Haloferax sp. wsp5]|nr:hypothetical protein C9J85_10075 [Haloferax sp. wsp5]
MGLSPATDYESFIADHPDEYDWPDLPEDQPAGMCYTSGTTGQPKGVEYTQKLCWTHVMARMTSAGRYQTDDVELTYVPSSTSAAVSPVHDYRCRRQAVLPGPNPSAEDLAKLIEEEDVTVSAAVPTVFTDLLEYARDTDVDFSSVRYFTSGGPRRRGR